MEKRVKLQENVYYCFARPEPTQPLHYCFNSNARPVFPLRNRVCWGSGQDRTKEKDNETLKDIYNRLARPEPIQPRYRDRFMEIIS